MYNLVNQPRQQARKKKKGSYTWGSDSKHKMGKHNAIMYLEMRGSPETAEKVFGCPTTYKEIQ